MPKNENILTAEEVAEYFRIHPYTVKRLARAGKLPGFKVGGLWRFRKDDIDQWSKSYSFTKGKPQGRTKG